MIGLKRFIALVSALSIITIGCSGTTTPVEPIAGGDAPGRAENANATHNPWGLWQFSIDPLSETIEASALRETDLHLNALRFLEPPVMLYLTIEGFQFHGDGITVDIGIRHPFLGLDKFTGFDVSGIMITSGANAGFADTEIRMAADGDLRLTNADGYSRWWNPSEFPHTETMFGYMDGGLGTGYAEAGFDCTINPYKYFCEDLDFDDPMSMVSVEGRGHFRAGQMNVRRYEIKFGSQELVFNYAVDACWKMPVGDYPYVIPDDFPPDANRTEAYRLNVIELSNTLWNDGVSSGGGISLSIDVYDHFNAGLNEIAVESPGSFAMAVSSSPVDEGFGFSQYIVDIPSATPLQAGNIELLITVESEDIGYQSLLPGRPVSAYFTYDAYVSPDPGTPAEHYVIGLPDWCSLTESCTVGSDNLQFMTNLITWDLPGSYNDEAKVKWWHGHLTWNPPYSNSIFQNHVNSLGYTFEETTEGAFDPTGCRMVIVVLIGPNDSQYIPFTAQEAADMKEYVANGGILCFMIEHPNYFSPIVFDPLMDLLDLPAHYGGGAEPPSTYTFTYEVTSHFLTTNVSDWQYWTAGEFAFESPDCVSLVRTATGENLVCLIPIDVS